MSKLEKPYVKLGFVEPEFDEIWCVDFEFRSDPAEYPFVLCMVATDLLSGRTIKCAREDLVTLASAPFQVGGSALFVAYYVTAELSCFHALGWPLPENILDLYVEFKRYKGGLGGPNSLLGALKFFDLPCIDDLHKEAMRALAMRGEPYTNEEQKALLDYCETDVVGLQTLLPAMAADIDLPRALLRGAYMKAVSIIERNGIPIDCETLRKFEDNWDQLKAELIKRVDEDFGVYEGSTFKTDRFASYLIRNNISWPLSEQGRLKLDADTFVERAKTYPMIAPLKELRAITSRMRLSELPVGSDGRNRCMLSPFSSKTGRNQPPSSQFIFGASSWLRGLIKPPEGCGIAYIDWSQQEFGIAAALSGDKNMMAAYESGDPYLEFAKQAKKAPPDATKSTHPVVREQFKSCSLGMNYSMGSRTLAEKAGIEEFEAMELIELHRQTYKDFWEWSNAAVDYAMLYGEIPTVFGWRCRVPSNGNPRSFANFPMQANGAEILRLACIYGVQRGVKICAPVHDAVLIEAPIDVLDEHINIMQEAMQQAGRIVLEGFNLRSDVKKIVYPNRYEDERGVIMWDLIHTIIDELTSASSA